MKYTWICIYFFERKSTFNWQGLCDVLFF